MASPSIEQWKRALAARGWQPARGDVDALFAFVRDGERDEAEVASRALARLGRDAADEAMTRFSDAPPRARARLVRLVGRVASATDEVELAFLRARLGDADDKTARNAALALARLGAAVENALVARWVEASSPLKRALAEALGKVGGERALQTLAEADAGADRELGRIVDEARLKIARTLGRGEESAIADEVAPEHPLPALAHCRFGLAALAAAELAAFSARVVDDETVSFTLAAPLSSLWVARTPLSFGFPIATLGDAASIEDAVVAALTSDAAWKIVSRLSRGAIRYRLEWADGGHRRALNFRVAARVARARPALRNDPTATLWEVVVRERPRDKPGQRAGAARSETARAHAPTVELWPRGLPDPRFAYRVAHVPASSHPTIAAALARVAGARPDDVVWDPFVGAGTELVERALLGDARALYGSDVDGRALALAKQNLAAARVSASLFVADARSFRPPQPPTLILTNPPMGRRVLDRHSTGELYRGFLAHAASLLDKGGRLVWISPRGDETLKLAKAVGLEPRHRQRIDMAGFWAELQSFTRR